MKQLATLTWSVLLALSILTTACRSASHTQASRAITSPEDCIQHIIALDDSLGRIRNYACETISMAATIRNYAEGMKKADFRQCPPEFSAAFERHRQAWLNMIPLVEKYPDMRGEMHVLFNQLELGKDAATFNPLLKNIWDTWAQVEAAMK